MELLYKVHDNLYVNLTNKCPYACTFCLRKTMDRVGESDALWLEREPTAQEIIKEFANHDMTAYQELVFCGFGELTEALDVLLEVANYAKRSYQVPVRLNTNGAGNLINHRNIVPEFVGLIDCVSISLNHPDRDAYEKLVCSKYKGESYDAMISFAKECVKVLPKVVMSTVATTITQEEEARCQEICDEIGATYRIRPYEY